MIPELRSVGVVEYWSSGKATTNTGLSCVTALLQNDQEVLETSAGVRTTTEGVIQLSEQHSNTPPLQEPAILG